MTREELSRQRHLPLFFHDIQIVDDVSYESRRVSIISNAVNSVCIAEYESVEGYKLLLSYDLMSHTLCPFDWRQFEWLHRALRALSDDLCRYFESAYVVLANNTPHEWPQALRLGLECAILCADTGKTLPPININQVDGCDLKFTYASIDARGVDQTSKVFINSENSSDYVGLPLRGNYRVSWDSYQDYGYEIYGSFIRGIALNNGLLISIDAPMIENMRNYQLGALKLEGLSDIEALRYLMLSHDFGVNGLKVDDSNYCERESLFYIAFEIRGIKLVVPEFVLGSVHFSKTIVASEEFLEFCDSSESTCFAWTYERSMDLVDAKNKAMNKVQLACDLIRFYLRQGRIEPLGELEGNSYEWDIGKKLCAVTVTDKLYLENCDDASSLMSNGQDEFACSNLVLGDGALERLRSSSAALIAMSEANTDNAYDSLTNAIRWTIKAETESSREDQIISLNTALEFCIKGETGKTLLESALEDIGYMGVCSEALIDGFWEANFASQELKFLGFAGISDDGARKISKRLKGQLKATFKNSNFRFRLQSMSKRLGEPITTDELSLLERVNSVRNKLLHGTPTKVLNTVDMERAIDAASTLIKHKIADVRGNRNECY